ncbi:nicotinate-nucleotide--dimethylbenzimidazole phosphoribosyltransferase [Kosakonia cowanii]|uniref:nicotinate-nucleotide--dimethylbenzimidazole phosphoribosyltransferase n=1 Tax=Kosakonia cowanii TaxID=208223 RepID=UPI0039B73508
MQTLARLLAAIPAPDEGAMRRAQQHLNGLLKPVGSLGRLESLAGRRLCDLQPDGHADGQQYCVAACAVRVAGWRLTPYPAYANRMHAVCRPDKRSAIRHVSRHPAKRASFGLLHYLQQRIQQAGKTAIQIFAAQ